MAICPFWSDYTRKIKCNIDCPFYGDKDSQLEECPFKSVSSKDIEDYDLDEE